MIYVNTLIIGAGPSGLAIAACLNKKGIESLVLEKEAQLGGLYRKLDPALPLLSPGILSRLPFDKGLYLPSKLTSGQFFDYLLQYAEKNEISLRMRFSVKTIQSQNDFFIVTSTTGESLKCRFLVDATGSHPHSITTVATAVPAFSIKKDALLPQHKVLIIGSGTSALELAERISESCETHIYLKKRSYFPVYLFGLNTHWLFRWLEILGRFTLNMRVHYFTEAVFYRDFFRRLKRGKIKQWDTLPDPSLFDLVISAIGYEKEFRHLPPELFKLESRTSSSQENYLVSLHSRFFILGQKQFPHLDSGFLRGIAKDARELAQKIADCIKNEKT